MIVEQLFCTEYAGFPSLRATFALTSFHIHYVTIIVGKVRLELTCNQLLFLHLIRVRRYIPMFPRPLTGVAYPSDRPIDFNLSFYYCSSGRIRTYDPLINSQML